MSFHSYRTSLGTASSIFNWFWKFHDRHPLPPWLNRWMRYALYLLRRVRFYFLRKREVYRQGESGQEQVVPRLNIMKANDEPTHAGRRRRVADAEQRFDHIHQVNRILRTDDGAWIPQPHATYSEDGVSIEEVALRVTGYLSAYRATARPEFLRVARQGGDYLRKERVYSDGHLRLQGHQVIDITYAFAGSALLELYTQTGEDVLLENAVRIGNRLVDYHISGSVNHAVIPVQFLGPLYQETGNVSYREEVRTRLFRSAVPFQLPYGGWLGHESWIWYHALITKSLVHGYLALPFDIEHQSEKDCLARTITAALNRFMMAQTGNGSFRIRPDPPLCETTDDCDHFKASLFQDSRFKQVQNERSEVYGHWNGYVIDALVTAYEVLDVQNLVPLIDRFGQAVVRSEKLSRLEFDTLGAGRYLEYVHNLRFRHHYRGQKRERSHSCNGSAQAERGLDSVAVKQ